MTEDILWRTLSEDGPWVLLVFYLLYRDVQKDNAIRDALKRNTEILVETTTMIRAKLMQP